MSTAELLLVAVGLAMDAFAVSISKGLGMKKVNTIHALLLALFFGVFQAGMPILGFFLGSWFTDIITSIDHWVAFVLLGFIGIKMIAESREEKSGDASEGFNLPETIVLAVATSIDALAVGVTFAFMKVAVFSSSAVIGVVTFFISLAGVYIGHYFGNRYASRSEMFGGLVLIAIGIKILLEGLL